MRPDEINVGDRLIVKAGFHHSCSKPIEVTITKKYEGGAEGGYVFETSPVVGSGFGLAAFWFDRYEDQQDLF